MWKNSITKKKSGFDFHVYTAIISQISLSYIILATGGKSREPSSVCPGSVHDNDDDSLR